MKLLNVSPVRGTYRACHLVLFTGNSVTVLIVIRSQNGNKHVLITLECIVLGAHI